MASGAQPTPSSAQAEVILSLGFETPLDSPQGVGARVMAGMMGELSGQRMQLRILPDGQAGNGAVMLDKVRNGELDLFQGGPGIFSSMERRLNVFDIPYLFDAVDQAHRILDGRIGLEMLAAFEAHGLKGLAFWETGMRNITNNVRPIREVSDLRGLRMRIPMRNPMQAALWTQLGTEPLPLAFGQIGEALKAGTADAQEHPISVIYAGGLHEVQRYLSLTGHLYTPLIQVMNLRRFDGLSDEHRGILTRASRAGAAAQAKFTRDNDTRFLASMKAQGVEVNELSLERRIEFRDRARPAMEALYAGDNGDGWLKGIRAAIEAP